MNDPTPDERGLHVVPDPEDQTDDPLLARAQRIAELPLDERPAAFDGLNRALVAELQTLEEG